MNAATQAHLEAISPGMAKRWMARAGSPAKHRANPERTVNLPKVRARELPGRQSKVKGGFQRDFGPLAPSSVARHKPAADRQANEYAPMSEGPVGFQVGSRPHKMGKATEPTGAMGRAVRAAAIRKARA